MLCVCVKFCVHELQVTQLERIIIFCGYVEQHESVFLNFFRLILSNICNQEVEFWLIDVAGLSFVAKQAAFDGVNLDEHVLIVLKSRIISKLVLDETNLTPFSDYLFWQCVNGFLDVIDF